jgi:uncharacterized integral membrane protein
VCASPECPRAGIEGRAGSFFPEKMVYSRKGGVMFKFIIGILFGILAVIFIMQNVQVVEVAFLGWTISMSRSILFVVMILIGFVLGWGVGSFGKRRRIKK